MSPTRDELLAECERMKQTMEYHEQIGVYCWPWIKVKEFVPEGRSECGICTNGARWLAKKFSGYVAGYPIQPQAGQIEGELIGSGCFGHDFAVIGEFIVDWWGWEYEQSITVPVLHRVSDAPVISQRFKPETDWVIFPQNDFRKQQTKGKYEPVHTSCLPPIEG